MRILMLLAVSVVLCSPAAAKVCSISVPSPREPPATSPTEIVRQANELKSGIYTALNREIAEQKCFDGDILSTSVGGWPGGLSVIAAYYCNFSQNILSSTYSGRFIGFHLSCVLQNKTNSSVPNQ